MTPSHPISSPCLPLNGETSPAARSDHAHQTWPHRLLWAAALTALFALRLFFGLSSNLFSEDQTQIFLSGLIYYATGAWPYYGPDVTLTKTQVPGALQGLVVGLPLKVVAVPEAPYVFVNLLSMVCLCLFAWYLSQRLRDVPRWLIFGWLLTLPWTLEYSTNIMNTSYVLPASLVFFIAFLEAWPSLSLGHLSPAAAHFLMGLTVAWIVQFHMSGAILLAFVAAALVWQGREGVHRLAAAAGAFLAGGLTSGSLILPTLWTYGLSSGGGGIGQNLQVQWRSPWILLKTVARILSFPSLEVGNFLGAGADRVVFVERHWLLVPFLVVVTLVGFAQPVWMAATWFRRRSDIPGWSEIRWLLASTIALVYSSYYLVAQKTEARAYYLMAPVAFTYAAYCWTFLDSRRWRLIAAVTMATNICFQVGVAWTRQDHSLYSNREVVAAAITLKQPDVFGHRRYFVKGVAPELIVPIEKVAHAAEDVEVRRASWSRQSFGVSHWSIAVRNRSAYAACRDPVYEATYLDIAGRVVAVQSDRVELVLQPGDSREVEFEDGRVPSTAVQARFRFVAVEPLRALVANRSAK